MPIRFCLCGVVSGLVLVGLCGGSRQELDNPEGKDIVFRFVTGTNRVTMSVRYATGWCPLITAEAIDVESSYSYRENGQEKWARTNSTDAAVQYGLFLQERVHVRPDVRFYRGEDRLARIRESASKPPASRHVNDLRFRRQGPNTEIWLEGSYLGLISNVLTRAWIEIPEGGELVEFALATPQGSSRQLELKRGGMPLDLSLHRECSRPGQELDPYFSRGAFTGMPESFIWNVPNRCWNGAFLTAALDPDTNKSSVLTVRLTRYAASGIGDAAACGEVDLRTAPSQPAGELTVKGRKLQLKRYAVPIPIGDIQDRLYVKRGCVGPTRSPFLHCELLGPRSKGGLLFDCSQRPWWKMRSGAYITELTLEESPCEMELLQSQPGLIFADDEKRETPVRVRANTAGEYEVISTIRDWHGKTVRRNLVELSLAANEERRIALDLQMPCTGWYSLDLELVSSGAYPSRLVAHHASFADVGKLPPRPDAASPFSAWWFGVHHGGTADIAVAGPIFHKMGIHRLAPILADQHTEATLADFGMTAAVVPFNSKLAMKAPASLPVVEMVRQYEQWMRDFLTLYPHVERTAMVFHESYCGGYPHYLWGGADRAWAEADFREARQRFEVGIALCRMIREKFPDMRIQLGNSGTSYEILDMLFRQKFPAKLFDILGSETVARYVMPDLPSSESGPSSLVYLRQVGTHYGYDKPVRPCYEWTCHLLRELGWDDLCAWGLRDALLALANGTTQVPVAGFCDHDGAYYNSDYGGGAPCRRYPLLYPSRGYYATSVMTHSLYGARFSRRLPTGSQTVNALEFRRADGSCVYAAWMPRGSAEVAFEGTEVRDVKRVDEMVAQRLVLGPLPQFVTTATPAERLRIIRRETPPLVEPHNFQLAHKLTSVAEVDLVTDQGNRDLARFLDGRYVTAGAFSVSSDGDSLILKREALSPIHSNLWECCYVKLSNPVVLTGEPATLSLEVEGNSSWADIKFAVEDSEGKIFTPTRVWYEGDGRALGRVNFDGWGTIQFPFSGKSRVKASEVDVRGGFWNCDSRGRKNQEIVYPVKIVGFSVAMPRYTVSGGIFEPVLKRPHLLRFRNIGMFD